MLSATEVDVINEAQQDLSVVNLRDLKHCLLLSRLLERPLADVVEAMKQANEDMVCRVG